MKRIPLTKGETVVVDDVDYDYLMQWKWYTLTSRSTKAMYAVRMEPAGKYKQKAILMHRVVAERMGLDLSHLIDHIDRDGLNNRRENLRSATRKQNNENISMRKDNTSGHRGVCWHKGHQKWHAKISNEGKYIHLGYFDDKQEAIKVRQEAEKKYFTHSEICK